MAIGAYTRPPNHAWAGPTTGVWAGYVMPFTVIGAIEAMGLEVMLLRIVQARRLPGDVSA